MKKNEPLTHYILQGGFGVRQLRILTWQFGQERSSKSAPQHAPTVVRH